MLHCTGLKLALEYRLEGTPSEADSLYVGTSTRAGLPSFLGYVERSGAWPGLAEKQEAQGPAERMSLEKEPLAVSGPTYGLFSNSCQFQIDLCRLIRQKHDFTCFRKIFPQDFRI